LSQGLDAEQMMCRSVPPSNMSLLGLIRHMADVERHWFGQVLSGNDMPRPFRAPGTVMRTSTAPQAIHSR
jgi:hypothetical protein